MVINTQSLFPTVEDRLAFGLAQQGLSQTEATTRVAALLAAEGRGHWAKAPVTSLSQGQRHYLCLLSILLMQPRTILLDEPLAGLDLPTQARLARRFATTASTSRQSARYSPSAMRTIAVLGLFIFGACESGAAKPQNAPQKPRDAGAAVAVVADADPAGLQGQQLYMTFCAQCHGADAKGYKSDNAPSLVNKTFLESANDGFIAQSIAQGRPGTSMAPYSRDVGGPLDRAAIDRIVAWLRSQGPVSVALGTVAKGDPARGAPIYARECAKCHGEKNVRATAVHLANPQFLAAASDAFLRYAIASGRPGTPMESFVTRLNAQEIDDVVAYVRGFSQAGMVEGTLPAPTGNEPIVLNPKGKEPVWKKLRSDPNTTVGRYVSVEEVNAALAAKKKMVIIDARPQSDWMRVHVAGAVSIPYHEVEKLDAIPKDVWAIAYCACPHHLSGIVVDELIKKGHKKALVLDEGILEWHRRGYPVTAAPGVQPPPKETGGMMAPGGGMMAPGGDHSGHGHP